MLSLRKGTFQSLGVRLRRKAQKAVIYYIVWGSGEALGTRVPHTHADVHVLTCVEGD